MSCKLLTKREAQRLIDYINGNGHGIFELAKVVEGADVPESKLECWVHTYKSDTSSPKETIFAMNSRAYTDWILSRVSRMSAIATLQWKGVAHAAVT